MKEFFFIDETFDKHCSIDSYALYMAWQGDAFVYCVHDLLRDKFILLRRYNLSADKNSNLLTSLFSGDEYLILKYKINKMLISSSDAVLIPASVLEKQHVNDYLSFANAPAYAFVPGINTLSFAEIVNLFAIPEDIHKTVTSFFPSCKFYQQATVMISDISRRKKYGKAMFVFLRESFIDVLVYDNDVVILCNTFLIQTPDDVLYYIANICKQLNLDMLSIPLCISGKIEKTDNYFNLLSEYLPQLTIDKLSSQFTYSYTFRELNLLEYQQLFNLALCE